LILLLSGAAILSFGALTHGSNLEEGATQLETLFRFARAEAASSGRPVRVFLSGGEGAMATGAPTGSAASAPSAGRASGPGPTEPTALPEPARELTAEGSLEGGIGLGWEPDPFGAPGRMEPLASAGPLVDQLNELVRVVSEHEGGLGSATPAPTAQEVLPPTSLGFHGDDFDAPQDHGPAPVTFYPDGSSDDARVVLMARNDADPRRMLVQLSGQTGLLKRRLLEPGDEVAPPADPVPPAPVDPVTGPPIK
jgi:hypothetical protein